ncbi:MAG TPA: hypothetical protein DDW54_04340 [Clostridiales bacterium]|nr:hypothetical protein [Clostridiales bacterium]
MELQIVKSEREKLARLIEEDAEKKIAALFPYLSFALGKTEKTFSDGVGTIKTDGKEITANPEFLIRITAAEGTDAAATAYMQATLSNLLTFTFGSRSENSDLAADVTLFYLTDEMKLPFGGKLAAEKRKAVYKSIKAVFGGVTKKFAEEYLARGNEINAEIFSLLERDKTGGEKEPRGEEELIKFWIDVAADVAPRVGGENAELKRAVEEIAESANDYIGLFRKFLKKSEKLKSSDDEFDYILYTYGLRLYKNVPLIENLEYRQDHELSDVIIAIDTSGSTKGEPVMKFLSEILGIIRQAESETDRIRVRIIQCDDKIRGEEVVSAADGFENYLKSFGLSGGGGTDFRPVFDRAEKLMKEGVKIRGLIYFTDGAGIYPKENPPFKTCFALYGEKADKISVPYYAYGIKVKN